MNPASLANSHYHRTDKQTCGRILCFIIICLVLGKPVQARDKYVYMYLYTIFLSTREILITE